MNEGKEQIAELLLEKVRRKIPSDFAAYIRYLNPKYTQKWFHYLIAEKCQDVYEGKIKKLMIFVPPQHGKSEITSRKFPGWVLGNDPSKKIVVASYSANLSASFARDCRRDISSPEYINLFGNVMGGNGFINNSDEYETYKKGFYKAVGVGGSLTGRPADIAIIDDPVKDAAEAYSETYRNNTWEWYTNVLETRLHNDSAVILIMTRWHYDDLAGRLLDREKDEWTVVTLPAVKETELGMPEDNREVGEALWPEKHSLAKLLRMQFLNNRTYTSLYQQRPVNEGGNIIKSEWFGKVSRTDFNRMKENAPITFFGDTAYTEKQKNDPSGFIATCKLGNNLYITHAKKVMMKFPDLIRFLPKYVSQNGYTNASTIRIEPKANGLSVIQQLQETTDLNIVETPAPVESKETRLNAASPTVEGGRIILVEDTWNDEFITEVCAFPAQPHDEYVDLLCYAINYHFDVNINTDLSKYF